jgi:hypothetical protein
VSRHSRTEIDGTLSRLLFEYEIDDHGVARRASEVHELGLFTTEEMMRAFGAAGLHVDHDPQGLTGRGPLHRHVRTGVIECLDDNWLA